MKLLLYCTKAKPYLRDYRGKAIYNRFVISPTDRPFTSDDTQPILNGKIVAECDFEVEEIGQHRQFLGFGYDLFFETDTLEDLELQKKSCLDTQQLANYFNSNANYGEKVGYAIHIKNLHIFDEPRELYDCLIHPKIEHRYYGCEHLSKAPKNMMYVELDDIKCVLISIRPEWLCKILNGEQTIIVRKKVLKEMI